MSEAERMTMIQNLRGILNDAERAFPDAGLKMENAYLKNENHKLGEALDKEKERVKLFQITEKEDIANLRGEVACLVKENTVQRGELIEKASQIRIMEQRVKNLEHEIKCMAPFHDPGRLENRWLYTMVLENAGCQMCTFLFEDIKGKGHLPSLYIPREDWDNMGSPVRIAVTWQSR